jgi:pyruvate kinase
MNLMWGVSPVFCGAVGKAEEMVEKAESLLKQRGAAREGDVIAIVAGTRSATGSTNFMRLHVVGAGR